MINNRKRFTNAIGKAVAMCLLAAGMFSPSSASQQGIVFGVTVGIRQYCQIVVTQSGTMTTNAGLTELSSKQPGGAQGQAEVTTTNGSFNISVDAPTSFSTMPTDGDTGVTYATSYSLSGATTAPETAGTVTTKAKRGVTDVAVDLVATRTGSIFPAGNYTGVTVLRCE